MDELPRDDAAHLKSLRLAADLDHAQLALMANLSAAQTRQLEDDGDSLFYSPQIKAQSLRRVIRLLETASQEQPTLGQNESELSLKSANVIDGIIRLSEKNLKSQVVHSQVRRPAGMLSKLWGVWGVALVFVAWGGWQYKHHSAQGLYSEWVEPITAKVLPPPEAINMQETPAPVTEVMAVAPVPLKTEAVQQPAVKDVPVAVNPLSPVDCANIQTEPVALASVSPNKPGSYVYLVASKATTVCVDDGQNKRTVVTLTPGAGRSIHGAAPWTLATADMNSVQVFFQGAKVWVPPEAGARIYLKEQPISP